MYTFPAERKYWEGVAGFASYTTPCSKKITYVKRTLETEREEPTFEGLIFLFMIV